MPLVVQIGAEVTVGSENFFTIIQQLASKAEITRFIVNPESVVFKVEEEMGGIELTLKSCTSNGLFQRCNIDCPEGRTYNLLFVLQFLTRLRPLGKIAPLLKLILPQDAAEERSPLRVQCTITNAATQTDCGYFKFYLAQQVDD